MTNFDGHSWVARTLPGEAPKIKSSCGEDRFHYIARKIREGLGRGGLVALINSRGKNDLNGADYRYEGVFDLGEKIIEPILDGSAFYIPEIDEGVGDVYVVKGQEVWTSYFPNDPESPRIAAFLIYGLPYEININNKASLLVLDEVEDLGAFAGLSKIGNKENFYKFICMEQNPINKLNFIVVHSGMRRPWEPRLINPNQRELNFYNCLGPNKEIGALSVTRAYDLAVKDRKPLVGRCYTRLTDLAEETPIERFFVYLKNAIKESNLDDLHTETTSEGVLQHDLRMVVDAAVREIKETIKYD